MNRFKFRPPGLLLLLIAALCGCASPYHYSDDGPGYRVPNKAAQRAIRSGLKHSNAEDYTGALPYYTKAVEADPANNFVRNYRLICYRGLKQYDLALQECNAMVQIAPQAVGPYQDRGQVLLQLNRPDEAMADFERAKIIAPASTAADLGIAQASQQKGDYDEALRRFNAIMQANPTWFWLRLNRGRCYLAKHDYDLAIADFDAYLKASPDGLGVLYWRAKALDQAGRSNEALAAYQDFHKRLSSARLKGSKTAQNLKNFGLYTVIGTVLLSPGLGLATVLDNPATGFTKSYDDIDAEVVKRIQELSTTPQ